MSNDWQVGDKAVRVACECGGRHPKPSAGSRPQMGAVFTVVGIRPGPFPNCRAPCALYLAERPEPHGFCSAGYRKIRPDEPEACEEEFRVLLNRSKRRVEA